MKFVQYYSKLFIRVLTGHDEAVGGVAALHRGLPRGPRLLRGGVRVQGRAGPGLRAGRVANTGYI